MARRKVGTGSDFNFRLLLVLFLLFSIFATLRLVRQQQDIREDALTLTGNTIWTYHSHPNYWPAGSHQWTAKRYFLVAGSKNPGYDLSWVWSGPKDGKRELIYQAYSSSNSLLGDVYSSIGTLGYKEYETWVGKSPGAVVMEYGGRSTNEASDVYPSYADCLSSRNGGTVWPDAEIGKTAVVAEAVRDTDGVCTHEYQSSDPKGGGYIAVKFVEDWDKQGSYRRNSKCDAWFPTTGSYNTADNKRVNQICKKTPRVGIVQHRYSKGYRSGNTQNLYGCEMVVYSWGNPYSSATNFQNWFRNGELRYTDYKRIGFAGKVAPDNDNWWMARCAVSSSPGGGAWDSVPNWYYSGVYRLDNLDPFIDNTK